MRDFDEFWKSFAPLFEHRVQTFAPVEEVGQRQYVLNGHHVDCRYIMNDRAKLLKGDMPELSSFLVAIRQFDK